jgi:hypothetical protein
MKKTKVIYTDNPPFNQAGEVEKKDAKPEADSLYGGNPAVMADAIEQMKNVRKLLKDRLKGVKENGEAIEAATAEEKVRLQGYSETKAPSLKPYTEAVDVKDRAELSQLVEKAKKEKKLFKIGRSMKEGFRYTFLMEEAVKEKAKPEFKVGSTLKIIKMAGEPGYTGKVGKITEIDDAGQLHGTWGSLALIPGEDEFEHVEVINYETGKIEEKKMMMEEVEEGHGTQITSFEQAQELSKGTRWVIAFQKYFDMYMERGYELFVKGQGDNRTLILIKNGEIAGAYDVNDKLVALESVMGKMPKMEAMPKMEGAPEEHHHDEEHKDEGEYDQEGDMAKSDLQIMADAALELHDMLQDEENLPEWVQAKITLATDYIDTARDYMKAKKDGLEFPEPEEGEEGIVELEPLEEAAPGAWGKEILTLQQFADAVKKLGRDDVDFLPILKGIAEGTHKAFVKHDGKDVTITILRGDMVETTLTSEPMEEGMGYEEALIEPKKGEKEADYVSRFMGSKRANKDFPNQKQRAAVAYSKFRAAKDKKEEMEPRGSKFFPGEDGDTEAHIFIEDKGIEDFDLVFDEGRGGYVLTWESKEEILESKGKVSISDIQEVQKELDEMSAGDNDYALSLIQELLSLLGEDAVPTSKPGSGDITNFQDLVMKTSAQDEEYAVALLHELEDIFEVVEEKLYESKEEKKHLKEETKILSSLNDFEPWSGAVSTWELIVNADKVEALDFMLEDLYPEGISNTELNDLLWFEASWILDMLSIDEDEMVIEDEEVEEEGEEDEIETAEDAFAALDDLDEEPVMFDVDELEEAKHSKKKHAEKEEKHEMNEDAGSIVKEVREFIAQVSKK